ncbi:hypothetical protein ACXYMO_05120 [Arenibacterium sp. CAU 1754]
MINRKLLAGLAFATAPLAIPCWAGVDLATADACIVQSTESGQNPAACIDDAHAACQSAPSDTPAVATLCYVEAKTAWTQGIKTVMADVTAKAPETIATIARIEVKYDILANLVQCDRIEELALAASGAPEQDIVLQKSRCTAAASGLAYVRLKWRAGQLP